jgi:microcystin-dependent protein
MDGFLGEIRMFAGDRVPAGWELCDEKLLSPLSNNALFSLLGAKYGGDGKISFGLPDLRGRTVLWSGSGSGLTPRRTGETGVKEAVELLSSEMPAHNHTYAVSSNPIATVPAPPRDAKPYSNFLGEMPRGGGTTKTRVRICR